MTDIRQSLSDPSLDLSAQLFALETLVLEIPALQTVAPDSAAWWVCWRAMMLQVLAEATLGAKEGMDSARSDFLDVSDTIAQAHAWGWARYQLLADNQSFADSEFLFSHAMRSMQSIRAVRQNLYWIARVPEASGRLPIFRLLPAATIPLSTLSLDPLERPLSRAALAALLNSLASGIQWRTQG